MDGGCSSSSASSLPCLMGSRPRSKFVLLNNHVMEADKRPHVSI